MAFPEVPSRPHPALPVLRASLPAAITAALRREIGAGRWKKSLPGERHLADLLQVSRTSLRPALDQLEKDGVLRTSHGRRREILSPSRGGAPAMPGVMGMISPVPLERIEPSVLLQLENLRELLSRRQMSLHIEVRPSCYSVRPERALQALAGDVPADVWLLWRSTRAMQKWFLGKGRKHVVFGTAYFPGAAYVDLDHHATGRHAAATLARLGHRRICIVIPDSNLAGDRASMEGFVEGGRESGCQTHVLKHDGTPAGVIRSVDRILSLRPRPTAILSAGGVQTIGVLTRLLESGLRVPAEMSLISRDDDPTLAYVNPRPAQYFRPPLKFAREMLKQIEHLFSPGSLSSKGVRIFPDFQSQRTLAAPTGL